MEGPEWAQPAWGELGPVCQGQPRRSLQLLEDALWASIWASSQTRGAELVALSDLSRASRLPWCPGLQQQLLAPRPLDPPPQAAPGLRRAL